MESLTDYNFLKTLDDIKYRAEDGSYPLLVSVNFGMRGLDFRTLETGIALFICTSFEHQRDAIQGLNRVGRFGEQCTRYLVDGVALIDEKRSSAHCAKVFNQIAASAEKVKAKAPVVR